MIVVFYAPDTGDIAECTSAPPAYIEADGRAWIVAPEFRPDWDVTHRVAGGELVPREA